MTKKCSFNDLGLSKELLQAIADQGFEEASPIQAQAIPVILAGQDVIGQAATGSGKTAAFAIPVIEKINPAIKRPQALILCPVRELAVQVSEQFSKFSSHKRGVVVHPVFGGQPIERQIQALNRGVHLIIGTPGRILDHIARKTIDLRGIEMVVLDEADKMLDMGFRDDIEAILNATSNRKQTLLFSATMAREILALAKRYQTDPVHIRVIHDQIDAPAIEQLYLEAEPNIKVDITARLIDLYNPKSTIIFCNTKRRVDELVLDLKNRGYEAVGIHGDITQEKRNRVMTRFKKGDVDILVATDVAARGIDVSNVEVVFNYDIPQDEDSYIHRIGRTGRAGKSGIAVSLVSRREFYSFKDIKRYTKANIRRIDMPTNKEVEATRHAKVLEIIKKTIAGNNLGTYTQVLQGLLQEDIATLDVCAALLKLYVEKK
jgi:ATP-dependent RNA helicase DeaD